MKHPPPSSRKRSPRQDRDQQSRTNKKPGQETVCGEKLRKSNLKLQRVIEEHQHLLLALRRSESRYRSLFAAVPDLIFRLNSDGTFLDYHAESIEYLFMPPAHIIGSNIRQSLLPQGLIDKTLAGMQTALRTGVIQTLEYSLKINGKPRDYEARLCKSAKDEIVSIVRDVTEQRLAEMERARLAAIVEFSSDAITSTSLDGRILTWNKGAERLYGYTTQEVLGKSILLIVPAERQDELGLYQEKMRQGHKVESFETVRLHKNGHRVEVNLTVSPLCDPAGNLIGISGIARDISERKRLESEILRVSEREQRRIAQDLHDGLGQELAGIACLAQVLQSDLAAANLPQAARAKKILQLLSDAVAQTRGLARGLYPVEAEPNGLMTALQALADRTQDIFHVKCLFHCPESVPVADNNVATHLYRIAQEAISNAIKHGRANQIDVGLRASSRNLILAIRDDGIGMRKSGRPTKGMGLRIMNYRAGIIGGTVVMQKTSEGGTEVVMTITLPPCQNKGG